MILVFNDPAAFEIYTLSLHDALPIWRARRAAACASGRRRTTVAAVARAARLRWCRSEEHTSELQSQFHLVCRLLLEKKNSFLNFMILVHHLLGAFLVS